MCDARNFLGVFLQPPITFAVFFCPADTVFSSKKIVISDFSGCFSLFRKCLTLISLVLSDKIFLSAYHIRLVTKVLVNNISNGGLSSRCPGRFPRIFIDSSLGLTHELWCPNNIRSLAMSFAVRNS